ncbi:hypothetical protein NSK_005659 [Nannochloropsis salina CCMP1776]|jgi:glutathione S-transferase|uniref:GST N-terminal domain-containing protein n=1 Tax=Nannochloropsis salina CCMP1776 TaxID=1027361 RepID=A0A4D9CWW3_9STRA|nr:hypothetical protein NSK_005659 [Nannochloropsis salina CCMP1776]|eukprot:TFJ83034.1 hypothetical protein NSK_005659 [Nannochloropsis salina CCMP1776]
MDHVLRTVGWFVRTPEVPKDGAKLCTIALSHYCEKARWALDLSPLRDTYIEDAHAPVFHYRPTIALTKDRKKTGLPVLVLPGVDPEGPPTVVQDSAEILQHLASLYPKELGHMYPPGEMGDKVRALERKLGEQLGPATRKIVYWEMWQGRQEGMDTCNALLERHYPTAEARMWRLLEAKILPVMLKAMKIDETSTLAALEESREIFREVSALLDSEEGGKGGGAPAGPRRYLLGANRMTAADLTFAALAYPLINPPAFASLGLSGAEASPWAKRLAVITEEFRATPAGQHVLRLYGEERFPETSMAGKEPTGQLCLRTSNRDKWPWQ